MMALWSTHVSTNLSKFTANQRTIRCKSTKDYGWDLTRKRYDESDRKIKEIRLAEIKRPLQKSRSNGKSFSHCCSCRSFTHGNQ